MTTPYTYTCEDFKQYVFDNYIVILFIVLLVAIFYINMKINNLDYRVQQTIVHSYENRSSPYQKWQ